MAVPFGFSIGDFIAASHVVRKIWQFASNSAGLRAEFTTLSEQYHELLDLVTRIALIHRRGNVSIAPATQNSIDLHLSRCRKLLEQFDKDASPAIARSGWRQSSQHLRTVLASDSAIKELNQRFEREISAIRSYVDLVVAKQQHSDRVCLRELQRENEVLSRNFTALIVMLQTMPKDLGYTWEGGDLKRHVTLIHGTGEQLLIPLEFWSSPERLHQYLLMESTYPGHKRMQNLDYRLTNCSNGNTIYASDTDQLQEFVGSGAKIVLSIVMGTWKEWISSGVYCPKCCTETVVDATLSGWRKCTKCDLEFSNLHIASWPFNTEPIDETFKMGLHDCDGEMDADSAQQLSDSAVDVTKASTMRSPKVQTVLDEYRDEKLKHITLVYGPIFNMVFRARGCMCRLNSDDSPFAPDIDLPWDHPCRLHYPPEAAEALGMDLKFPVPGYEPRKDRYFDRFGGHRAFANFILTDPLIGHTLSIRSLLPRDENGQLLPPTEMIAALQVESQRDALFEWQRDWRQWYFKRRSTYSPEELQKLEVLKLKMSQKAKEESGCKVTKRRDSFA